MPGLSSIAKPILMVTMALSTVIGLAAPGCLGRSDVDDLDLTADGAVGTTGFGGRSTGGTSGASGGKAGSSGKGGASGKGGTAGKGGASGKGGVAGGGGSAGVGGVAGKGGSAGKGGTGGGPSCGPNCQGCCDAAGMCRPGKAINACGGGGVDCVDCSALGVNGVGG